MPSEALTYHSRSPSENGTLELGEDPVRRAPGVVDAADPVDDHPELVAAEAGDRVAGPEAALEPLADRDEEAVADGVAEALVDHLEAVEVEQDQGDRVGLDAAIADERMAAPGRSAGRGSAGR